MIISSCSLKVAGGQCRQSTVLISSSFSICNFFFQFHFQFQFVVEIEITEGGKNLLSPPQLTISFFNGLGKKRTNGAAIIHLLETKSETWQLILGFQFDKISQGGKKSILYYQIIFQSLLFKCRKTKIHPVVVVLKISFHFQSFKQNLFKMPNLLKKYISYS